MKKENLIPLIGSVLENGRKIVKISIFICLGVILVFSLCFQNKAIMKTLNFEKPDLSLEEILPFMPLLLRGALLLAVLAIILYVLVDIRSVKEFIRRVENHKSLFPMSPMELNVYGFIVASVMLLLLPYNIITMGVVFLGSGIWRDIEQIRERLNSCQVKGVDVKKKEV